MISAGGSIPQLAYICGASQWKELEASQFIVSRPRRERTYDSEVTVLADDHPILRMIAAHAQPEHAADEDLPSPQRLPWPYGLRALDAMDDAAPRVREAAEIGWKSWVRNMVRDAQAAWSRPL